MGTAANVRVGVDGTVHVAPISTELPTDASTALAAGFVDVGFVSDEGLTEAANTSETEVKVWNGDTVRTLQTEHSLTFNLTLMESNDETRELFYGPMNGAVVEITGKPLPRQAMVFNIFDGNHTTRIVLPSAQVTGRGEVQHVSSDAVKYPITVTAYPDTSGVKAYVYTHIIDPETIPTVNEAPAAFTPTVSSVTDTGASVAFSTTDPDGDTLTYKLAVTESSTPPSDWSGYTDVTSPQAVSDLTAETTYYAHVRAFDGELATVGTSASFTTTAA